MHYVARISHRRHRNSAVGLEYLKRRECMDTKHLEGTAVQLSQPPSVLFVRVFAVCQDPG
jgi:hypothetical protein